jgi:hypothetical protein
LTTLRIKHYANLQPLPLTRHSLIYRPRLLLRLPPIPPLPPIPLPHIHPFGVEIGISSQREVTLGADKYIRAFVAEISYMKMTRSTVEPMADFPPLRTKLAYSITMTKNWKRVLALVLLHTSGMLVLRLNSYMSVAWNPLLIALYFACLVLGGFTLGLHTVAQAITVRITQVGQLGFALFIALNPLLPRVCLLAL